jgi:hypothetical protein
MKVAQSINNNKYICESLYEEHTTLSARQFGVSLSSDQQDPDFYG